MKNLKKQYVLKLSASIFNYNHPPAWCAGVYYIAKEDSRVCPPLSGDDIWIKVLPQKRSTVYIYVCDIWNDLRPFLKYLAQPFSSKLRSKEAKGLKSGNLGK